MNITHNELIKFLLLLIFIVFVFWNGLWGGAPRADQLAYLHQISKYQTIWDILVNSPDWNRTQSTGDFILFRPILYLQLGLFYYFFKYNFFYWQLASLVLHMLVIMGLYILLCQGRLKHSLYPFLLSAFFGTSYLSSELVLWNHISGYLTFSLFVVFSVLFTVKFFQTYKVLFGIVAAILAVLAEFTYELGVVLSSLLAIVLIYNYYNKSLSSNTKKIHLMLAMLFIGEVALYPMLSIIDLTLRGQNLPNIVGNSSSEYGFVFSFWYALIQIIFWMGGWLFPTGFNIHAGSRATFISFNFSNSYFFVNFSAIILGIGYLASRIKRNTFHGLFINRNWLYVLPTIIFLFFYSYVIAFGRALPRGLNYVLKINIYYQYIACLALSIMFAIYFLRERHESFDKITNKKLLFEKAGKISWNNVILISILTLLVFFNSRATFKLASEYRYNYSPNKFVIINAVQHFIQHSGRNTYFVIDSSCSGNSVLSWFNGHFQKGSGWTGIARFADVLFPEKSFDLNKTKLTKLPANSYSVVKINCTKGEELPVK